MYGKSKPADVEIISTPPNPEIADARAARGAEFRAVGRRVAPQELSSGAIPFE